MNIGIWGAGIVGSATGYLLEKGHKVWYYDKYKKNPKFLSAKGLVRKCKIIFISVPTPMKKSGKIDLNYLRNSLDEIDSLTKSSRLIVIRSSAVSGSTKQLSKEYPKFDFAFNPEFLREKYAKEDILNTVRIIIGVDKDKTFKKLKRVYRKISNYIPIIKTSFEEAETIKYISNIMLASQIAVANEIYNICQKLGVDYEMMRCMISYDNRIGTNIKVPGHDGDFGFGGKCFPKDLNAFIYVAREHGYRPHLLEEIWRLNLRVRKNKDWLEIKGAVSNKKFKNKEKNG